MSLSENSNKIIVQFGRESEEQITIFDQAKRKDIFDSLRIELSNFEYHKSMISVYDAGKAQIFAFIILVLIFSWSLYLSIQIEKGFEYELIGSGASITAIVLMLANLGTINLVLLLLFLLSITAFKFHQNMKNRSMTETIRRA